MAYYKVKLDTWDLENYAWRLATIPVITHAAQNRDRYSIPYRDGEIDSADEWRGNAYITCSFMSKVGTNEFSASYAGDTMDARINRLYRLLNGKHFLHILIQNCATLTNWDEAGYYEIIGYVITNETRMSRNFAKVEVQFEVYPYKFLENALTPVTSLRVTNAHDIAMPYYSVGATASGATVTFTVNGNAITVQCPNDTDGVFVDTRIQMAFTASQEQGYLYNKVEIPATGDFTKLRLPADSTSTIALGTNCRTVITYPRWGYRI